MKQERVPSVLLCDWSCGCKLWSHRKTNPDEYWLTFCDRHGGRRANAKGTTFYKWKRRTKP